MSDIKSDHSFTETSLVESKIIFGGLVSQVTEWTDEEIQRYSNTAVNSLSIKRDDLSFDGQYKIVDKLGQLKYAQIMRTVRAGDQLDEEILSAISETIGDLQYVAFSRIKRDEITKDQSEEMEEIDGIKKYWTKYTTNRRLVVYFEVYDLALHKLVWSGQIERESFNSSSNPHKHDSNVLKSLANKILEGFIYGTYPEPPSLEKLVEDSFAGIAENLPSKSCSELGFTNCLKKGLKRFFSKNNHGELYHATTFLGVRTQT
jgi:hypothetical protein